MRIRGFTVGTLLIFASAVSAQTFTDASELLPQQTASNLGGTAIADIDGDGRVDLLSERDVFRQTEGGFELVDKPAYELLAADVDGDGLSEFVVFFGVGLYRYQPARKGFERIRNLGALINAPLFIQGSAWIDYDLDGRIDFFVGNDIGPDFLLRQRADGTFENISEDALPPLDRGSYGVAPADYDRDGDPDIYVGLCGEETENLLYRNEGTSFDEVASAAGGDDPRPSWGVVWLDFDNDGWLDLFVANMPISENSGENGLFRNNGDGTFTDVAGAAGVAGSSDAASWSATAADFDNDGWLDIFVANDPEPSELYRNNGDGTFSEIASSAGLPELSGIQLASGDVDGDGWVDLFMHGEADFWMNDGGTNGWLSVDLAGIDSTPDGIGARVEVAAGDLQMVREITAGDGFMSQSHGLRAHFGLGTATSADVTVRWPSGQVDELTGIAANQAVTIVEGVGLNAPPAMFGLAAPADGAVVPPGEPVTLEWEAADDIDEVTYTVHLAAPDGTDATFETAEATLEVPASAFGAEGVYRWAVVARDTYSARTSLDNASFANNPDVANEAGPATLALNVEAWPNPVQVAASIRFELPTSETVWLEVLDVLGRRVQRVALGARRAGAHTETLDVSGLPAGTYVVRVEGARSGSASAMITRVE